MILRICLSSQLQVLAKNSTSNRTARGLKRASERGKGKGKSCVQPDTICYPDSVTPSRLTAACQFIASLHRTAETQIAGGIILTFSATVSFVECYSGLLVLKMPLVGQLSIVTAVLTLSTGESVVIGNKHIEPQEMALNVYFRQSADRSEEY